MSHEIAFPSPERFIFALGKTFDSREFQAIASAFKLSWEQAKKAAVVSEGSVLSVHALGLRLCFKHENVLLNRPFYEEDPGQLVLADCTFYAVNQSWESYAGQMWAGLGWKDTLSSACEKLGQAPDEQKNSGAAIWDSNSFRLGLTWSPAGDVSSVSYWFNPLA